MDPNTTILRVKRKRGTDPADALLLACKRIRPETSQGSGETVPEPNEAEVENSVFKLVATVATQVRGPGVAGMALANVNTGGKTEPSEWYKGQRSVQVWVAASRRKTAC